jgi:cell fate regulator YaaT (PSP1 superfamily)
MPITPLPQFEADLEEDRQIYARLKPPTSIVVRFGVMRLVGEFPYSGDSKPGCGSKVVVRTHRGTELGEMLTSTCPNAGCSKSVTRKDMLQYIENSGGKDYPFFEKGRVLRIATVEDLNRQASLDAQQHDMLKAARQAVNEIGLPIKVVEAEAILGGEKLTFYFTSEKRVDFRDLVNRLAAQFKTRIEMRQVGARGEARLVADYERCGQHCCCKQFLKVLKPVSMRSAKTQKATLDPLKISGRCGRLMCCLRYEDESYEELKRRLPKRKKRVLTDEGPGIVIDTQILTQLVLVALEDADKRIAVPVEELGDPNDPEAIASIRATKAERQAARRRGKDAPFPNESPDQVRPDESASKQAGPSQREPQRPRREPTADPQQPAQGTEGDRKRRRRRRKRRADGDAPPRDGAPAPNDRAAQQDRPADLPDHPHQARERGTDQPGEPGQPGQEGRRRKRRRRRGGRGGSGGGGGGGGPDGASGGGGGAGGGAGGAPGGD